jgi:hypothetical protein
MNNSTPFFSDFLSFPLWYHALNAWYFVTNIYVMIMMEKVNIRLGVPKIWTWIIIYGLIGGLVEHISPYIPSCTITVEQEVLLFRWPTIVPGAITGLYLLANSNIQWNARLLVVLMGPILIIMSNDFFGQDSAASLTWEPFHVKHIWQPHLIGPLMVTCTYYCSKMTISSENNNNRKQQ